MRRTATIRADQVGCGQVVLFAGLTACRHRPRVIETRLERRPGRPPQVHLVLSGPPGRLVLGRADAVTVLAGQRG